MIVHLHGKRCLCKPISDLFQQKRTEGNAAWHRYKRAIICIGMGIALIAFVGRVFSDRYGETEKSMFTVLLDFILLLLLRFR